MADDKKGKLLETNKELEKEFKKLEVNERDYCNITLKYLKIKNIDEIKAIDEIKDQQVLKDTLFDMLQESDDTLKNYTIEMNNKIRCAVQKVLENIFTNEVIKNVVFRDTKNEKQYTFTNSVFFNCLNEILTTKFDIAPEQAKVLVKEVVKNLRKNYNDEED